MVKDESFFRGEEEHSGKSINSKPKVFEFIKIIFINTVVEKG